jgi:tmRNA-binding protein
LLSSEYSIDELKENEENYIKKYTQQERELLLLKNEINNLKTKLQQQEFFYAESQTL